MRAPLTGGIALPIGCSSCVGHAAVTACDRRTVRSAQPAAAGRRPAARGAAPPEGKIVTTLGAALATLASASRSSRLHCRLARAAAEACASDGVRRCNAPLEGPGQRSSGPSSSGRWRELQAFISFAGVGSPTLRAAARTANTSDLCSPLARYDQSPSHAWRPGDRGLAGRDPGRQMSNRDDGGVGRAARLVAMDHVAAKGDDRLRQDGKPP